MELTIRVQVLDQVVCILLHTKALRKGMNPSVLSLAMEVGETGLFRIGKGTSLGEGKF